MTCSSLHDDLETSSGARSDPLVDRLLQEGRRLFPGVGARVQTSEFSSYVAERVASTRASGVSTHGAHLWLVFAALRGDPHAIAHLKELLLTELAHAVKRRSSFQSIREDIAQELLTRLTVGAEGKEPKLLEYSGRGPLGAWLRAAVVGIGLNLERAGRPWREADRASSVSFGAIELMDRLDDPEITSVRASSEAQVLGALSSALADLAPAERALLRFRFRDGLTLEELATLQRVNRSTVVRRLSELCGRVLQSVRSQLRAKYGLRVDEVESLVRAAGSQLELRLSELFATQGPVTARHIQSSVSE